MPEIKTNTLTGLALDHAVAMTGAVTVMQNGLSISDCGRPYVCGERLIPYKPSLEWSQCGPLIEKYEIEIQKSDASQWIATTLTLSHWMFGETPLIAACRAIVASQLGDEVEIPAELIPN